jgi:ketosteroid isomerase-like protein
MGVKENLELIEELQLAARDRDFDRYGQLLAADAVFRAAGVPAGLGGVFRGRDAIVDQLRQTGGAARFEIKQMFGDDKHVCVVGKVSGRALCRQSISAGRRSPLFHV